MSTIRPLTSGLVLLASCLLALAMMPTGATVFAQDENAATDNTSDSNEGVETNSGGDEKDAAESPNDDDANAENKENDSTDKESTKSSESESSDYFNKVTYPLIVLGIGIAIVLGLIVVFKFNAFIALIIAAISVSLMSPGSISSKISRVADSFGSSAGSIAIVIALAAVIGKCMLDSGAADRIVRMFLGLLGEKRAPMALMGSGFVLAVPVFFDTVFYLLVPLARSLHRKTKKQYLTYILAIGAGGAITHTLVPPTPGPLLMAANLGIDVGKMILIGALVALPAAFVGLFFGKFLDKLMKTPMRDLPGRPEPEPLADEDLPPLWLSLAPVVLPILLIAASTVATTIADSKQAAIFRDGDIADWDAFTATLQDQNESEGENVGKLILSDKSMADVRESLLAGEALDDETQASTIGALNKLLRNKEFYEDKAFLGILIERSVRSEAESNLTRQKPVLTERMNRRLLEAAYPEEQIKRHDWKLPSRRVANLFGTLGNANLALLISALIAMFTLFYQRGMSLRELGMVVEESLMSGGVIILITAAGGAFGGMLQEANIAPAIQQLFSSPDVTGGDSGLGGPIAYLTLGFAIAAVLKIAQGSSTVAMIVGSAMMAAITAGEPIGCNYVYLATAIGAGSLIGSWMNDSGFWIFAKMGGLTEVEALKTWTLTLLLLGVTSFLVTILLATIMPMV